MADIISFPGVRYPELKYDGMTPRHSARVEKLIDCAIARAERDPVYRRKLEHIAKKFQKPKVK